MFIKSIEFISLAKKCLVLFFKLRTKGIWKGLLVILKYFWYSEYKI